MSCNILLISTNIVERPYPVYPLGISCLAGALKNAGHKVYQWDFLAQDCEIEPLKQLIKSIRPDVIGISIRNIDTVDSLNRIKYLEHNKDIIKEVRKITDSSIIIGGPGFSILAKEIMDFLDPDYGVVGEGEEIMLSLVSQIESKTAPPKKIILNNQHINGYPDYPVLYEPEIASYYLKHGGMLNVQSKRGCPFNCAYCSYPYLEGKQLRFKDPEHVVEDMIRASQQTGINYFFITDSVFNDPAGHYLEFCEIMIKKEVNLSWCAYIRPKNIGDKEIALMKRAGLKSIELGTDASTDITLEKLNKGFTMEDVFEVHKAAIRQDVPCAHFIIFGGPGETMATFSKGLENIKRLTGSVVFGFLGIRILPFTDIYNMAMREGVITKEHNLMEPVFYFSEDIDPDILARIIKSDWGDDVTRIFPCHIREELLAKLHDMGYVGPIWDTLLKMPKRRRRRRYI